MIMGIDGIDRVGIVVKGRRCTLAGPLPTIRIPGGNTGLGGVEFEFPRERIVHPIGKGDELIERLFPEQCACGAG